MKNLLLTGLTCAVLTFAYSCKKDSNPGNTDSFGQRNTVADYAASTLPVQTVSGEIVTNTTWDNSKVWEVSNVLIVRSGATLTINPGTFIKGTASNLFTPRGAIVVLPGGKINAVGTPEKPIVFTSHYLLDGNAATYPYPGDFGGIILLGKAHVNTGTKHIEGLPASPYYLFGGSNETDNSGIIRYVRIEYAGFNLSPDNEINGLTCGGVGSGTVLDHIEVSYNKDDSFEFFGGSVNASYLISKAPDDDNFDFDNGYNGTISYAVAIADLNATHSRSGGNSDSNGIESDNNAPLEDASFRLTPKTHPVLEYFTIIGTRTNNDGYRFAIRNRRGAEIELYDSIVTGYPSGLVFNDGTNAFLTSGVSYVEGNSFHGFTDAITPTGAFSGNTLSTSFYAQSYGMTQPFFNIGPLNFAGATNGAFMNGTSWTAGWSTL